MTNSALEEEIAQLFHIAVARKPGAEWIAALEKASDDAVLGVISLLSPASALGVRSDAMRESARASFDARMAMRSIQIEERLEKAATRLGIIGIVATIVIGIATIVVPLLASRIGNSTPHNQPMQTDDSWSSPSHAAPTSTLRPSGSA